MGYLPAWQEWFQNISCSNFRKETTAITQHPWWNLVLSYLLQKKVQGGVLITSVLTPVRDIFWSPLHFPSLIQAVKKFTSCLSLSVKRYKLTLVTPLNAWLSWGSWNYFSVHNVEQVIISCSTSFQKLDFDTTHAELPSKHFLECLIYFFKIFDTTTKNLS